MEKWEVSEQNLDESYTIYYPSNPIADCYEQDNAELIVKMQNACVSINPEHPELVAENIERMYQVLKCSNNILMDLVKKHGCNGITETRVFYNNSLLSSIEGDK